MPEMMLTSIFQMKVRSASPSPPCRRLTHSPHPHSSQVREVRTPRRKRRRHPGYIQVLWDRWNPNMVSCRQADSSDTRRSLSARNQGISYHESHGIPWCSRRSPKPDRVPTWNCRHTPDECMPLWSCRYSCHRQPRDSLCRQVGNYISLWCRHDLRRYHTAVGRPHSSPPRRATQD